MQISKHKVVNIHYTLKDEAGTVLDSSEGREPLAYIQGIGNLISGLEAELEAKEVGAKFDAVVKPEDAYGVRNPELVQQIDVSQIQGEEPVEIGTQIQVETNQGMGVATVVELENDKATLDMNHALADMTLHFNVEVVEIREATTEELDHGHVHGPGGHDH